ncbi:MAG TPA: 50S ribosomal protein L13 [Candidatus Omnitrophota bacterium]|nr:50S ribosomal protein L13 [Candidatus Omnitrophota bacterium]
MKNTYFAKAEEVQRNCYLIDANNKILGRVATKVAAILRGKHKRIFTPHVDTGDVVIIINAEKIRVTGKKLTDKIYQRYTGYPGGQKLLALQDLLKKKPEQVLELAINRMIPKGPLGNSVKRKLRIYAGDKHPHQAQKPIALEV